MTEQPILLELFAGTRCISKAFEKYGWRTFSVDWNRKFKDISLYADISKLTVDDVLDLCGRAPDVIWASPDCTSYSIAGIGYHRRLKFGDGKNGAPFPSVIVIWREREQRASC